MMVVKRPSVAGVVVGDGLGKAMGAAQAGGRWEAAELDGARGKEEATDNALDNEGQQHISGRREASSSALASGRCRGGDAAMQEDCRRGREEALGADHGRRCKEQRLRRHGRGSSRA